MPNLAGIVNLQDDIGLDMQLSSNIGSGIGNYMAGRKREKEEKSAAEAIRQQEEKDQLLQQNFVGMMSQAVKEDWEPPRILEEMAKVKQYSETEFGRRLQAQAVQEQYQQFQARKASERAASQPVPEGMVKTGGKYENGYFIPTFGLPPKETTTSQELALLTPEEQRQRALIRSGIEPRATAKMPRILKGQDGYYSVNEMNEPQKLNIPVENTAIIEIDVNGQPTKVIYDKSNKQIIGEIGKTPQKPTYRQDNDGRLYLVEGTDSTPVSGMQMTKNSDTEQMKILNAKVATEDEINTLKVQLEKETDDEMRKALQNKISRLVALNATRDERLKGSKAAETYNQAQSTAQASITQMGKVKQVGESIPLAPMLEKIPQTQDAGLFDDVRPPAKIKEAMRQHVQLLIDNGLSPSDARSETERQYRKLQMADAKNSWKTLPAESIALFDEAAAQPQAANPQEPADPNTIPPKTVEMVTLSGEDGKPIGTISAPPKGKVIAVSPDGQYGYIDESEIQDAISQGYGVYR
jgi:hypothetical protein